ncbi:hypothetical protein KSP39_PZI014747 [Platanthera zijinensis]|uniref:Uncharacterized protein n=1 Tax=Platanthera zijinensis TaxID=2320716 RepID=A0AAP0BBY4_9ASPA
MGNKPGKEEPGKSEPPGKGDEILVKVMPPVDRTYIRWLTRDLQRLHGYTPKNPRAIEPPENVVHLMRLNGDLDLDMNDPDLAPLFR